MYLRFCYLMVATGIALLLLGFTQNQGETSDDFAALITIEGPIEDVNARFLSRSIEKSTGSGAQLLIIQLATPGGALTSTRDMVESLLSSQIPTAVYVAPPGARAASAGTFITAAANFAAMSPGTNIGAASPITSTGEDLPETLAKKINEDTRAFIRSIADTRGRNSKALEETVTIARSYSATEAIELNVVDIIATGRDDLLVQLDGKTADTPGGPVVLNTKSMVIREIKKTLLENFLGVVADPNLAFIFLVIGGLGILAEFLTPGFIGPGVVGAIALALAFLGMGQLAVNWIGVGLILFAMVLFFLETQESGVGILAIGGIICFILGSFLLFGGYFSSPDISEPGTKLSPWLIGLFSGGMGLCLVIFLYLIRPTGTAGGDYSSPIHSLVGTGAVVTSELDPSGTVTIGGREWRATSDLDEAISEGEEVKVTAVFGRVLKVARPEPEVPVKKRFSFGKLLRKPDD